MEVSQWGLLLNLSRTSSLHRKLWPDIGQEQPLRWLFTGYQNDHFLIHKNVQREGHNWSMTPFDSRNLKPLSWKDVSWSSCFLSSRHQFHLEIIFGSFKILASSLFYHLSDRILLPLFWEWNFLELKQFKKRSLTFIFVDRQTPAKTLSSRNNRWGRQEYSNWKSS